MKILIACEESQEVCKAFRELGFEAYSCDLQECSGGKPEWHIVGDAVKEAYSGKYDMMIAHPPCTYMSRAGARWMYPTAGNLCKDRYAKAMEAKAMFLELLNAPIEYIAIENPTPLKVVELPKQDQAIQPYEYGHEFSKRTLLWLKNLPLLKPTDIKSNYKPYLPSNTGGKKRGQKYQFVNISQKESSKTFSGVAKGMAEQWGTFIRSRNVEEMPRYIYEDRLVKEKRNAKLQALDADEMYYVQDSRSYCGNSVFWWAKESRGYTTDLNMAHKYTKDEIVKRFSNGRETDIIWKASHVEQHIKTHVDAQYLERDFCV